MAQTHLTYVLANVSQTIDFYSSEELVLSTDKAESVRFFTNAAGREDKDLNFEFDEEAEVFYSCSLTWQNELYVFGAASHNAINDGQYVLVIGGGGTYKTEKCSIKNEQVTCASQSPELKSYKNYPEVFLVPKDFCQHCTEYLTRTSLTELNFFPY